jgi:uracil-DNA glycosylase family 4
MSKAALHLLRAHLDEIGSKGRSHVALTGAGREALQRLVHQPLSRRSTVPKRVFEEPEPLPPPSAPAPLTHPTSDVIEVPGSSLEEKLAYLAAQAEDDPKPRALGTLRNTMVFAVGSPRSQLMFIGEAPGAEEERQREPFVGPAGQLLTKIITAMGSKREEVYISNICKFRPSTGDYQGSGNRQPSKEEMDSCLPYIRTEISLIHPKVIVALGATAATGLGIEGPVGRLRGRFHEFAGVPVMITYHPSYLLRQEAEGRGNEAKRLVWEDLLQVMEKLGWPISDKQRAYFKPKA